MGNTTKSQHATNLPSFGYEPIESKKIISYDTKCKNMKYDGLSEDLNYAIEEELIGSNIDALLDIETVRLPFNEDNITLIQNNWSEYQRMFYNIHWKVIPNSFTEILRESAYFNLVLAIFINTNNKPSQIRNQIQFIDILKEIKDFETTDNSLTRPATFYIAYKRFIDNNLEIDIHSSLNLTPENFPSHHSSYDNLDAYTQSIKNATTPLHIEQLKQQKIWVIFNIILLLFVSGISLPLLYSKSDLLNTFYNDAQCCYCLWVGQNYKLEPNCKIEWSMCAPYKHPQSQQNINKMCYINDEYYCMEQIQMDNYNMLGAGFSTTSSVFGYKFHKSYPYYGYLNVFIAIIYVIYLILNTFYYKILLSVQLFVGNMVLAADTSYTYIKLYQYSKHDYKQECPKQPPPPITICYKNAIDNWMENLLHAWVIFVMFCMVYPFVLTLCCRLCNRINCCRNYKSNMEICLRNLGLIGGILFVIFALFVFIEIIIVRDTDFNTMENIGIPKGIEKLFVILVVCLVTIFAFDVFLLQHCRDRTKLMYDNCICRKNNNNEIYWNVDDNTLTKVSRIHSSTEIN